MAPERTMDETVDKTKEITKRMLTGAALVGGAGASWGAVLAALRNESIPFYAASMGTNFFLFSSTYIALEEIIIDKVGKSTPATGAAAGAMTGGFYAGIFGGRVRGLQGALAGAAIGAAAQFGRTKFNHWRLSKGLERYEEKYGKAPAQLYYPDSGKAVESKPTPQPIDIPSILPNSSKISEEEIERRIQVRLEEMRKDAAEGKDPFRENIQEAMKK